MDNGKNPGCHSGKSEESGLLLRVILLNVRRIVFRQMEHSAK
jgi:hypothetical protein